MFHKTLFAAVCITLGIVLMWTSLRRVSKPKYITLRGVEAHKHYSYIYPLSA